MKYVIKFITADGCVAFEDRESDRRPEDYLYRLATSRPYITFGSARMADLIPVQRRMYSLYDAYMNKETGYYTYEYRERL